MSLEKPSTTSSFEEIKNAQEAIVSGIEEGMRLAHEYFKDYEARKLSIEIHEPLTPILMIDDSDSNIPDDIRKMPACYSVKEGKLFINLDQNNPHSLVHFLRKISNSENLKRKMQVISSFIAIHEYTHHIQSLHGQFVNITFDKLVEIEAQADYYAGKVFNYHSALRNILTKQDEDAILEFLALTGSDVDIERIPGVIMDLKTGGGHDMGVIRKGNFLDGYTGVNNQFDFKKA